MNSRPATRITGCIGGTRLRRQSVVEVRDGMELALIPSALAGTYDAARLQPILLGSNHG